MLQRLETDPRFRQEFEERPTDDIVVTGFAQLTPLGRTWETFQGMVEGKSGVRKMDNINNFHTNIAAPVEFNPEDHFTKRELRFLAPITAMAVLLGQEAGLMAGTIDPETKKRLPSLKKHRVASWVSTGMGATDRLIDIYNLLHKKDSEGREDPRYNSRHIPVTEVIKFLIEEVNGQFAIALDCGGPGGNTIEACATGLSNQVVSIDIIRQGKADVVYAGAVDHLLENHPEVTIGSFATTGALSGRNDEPERASRPFDQDRDGFVFGTGGGVVVFEREDHARKRGAKIYARVLGGAKFMDGQGTTELDPENVAHTITIASFNQKTNTVYYPDAIFAHATSTKKGDPLEALAFQMAYGDKLKDIPIAAIKSNIGHLAGGAGAVNLIAAIQAINSDLVPPILNLENPIHEVEYEGNVIKLDLNFVRGKPLRRNIRRALAVAYGFGGYNAAILLEKYAA